MITIFTFLILAHVPAGASTTSASLPRSISVEIVNGDAIAHFKIDSHAKTLTKTTRADAQKIRILKPEDIDFLVAQVNKLPSLKQAPKECYRARMQIVVTTSNSKVTRKESCFGMHSITSEQYQKFASLLAVL